MAVTNPGRTDGSPKWSLAGAGPMTIREAARRIERDVKGVHADVHTLLAAGPLRKTDDGRIVFPYDVIHVDFTLRAACAASENRSPQGKTILAVTHSDTVAAHAERIILIRDGRIAPSGLPPSNNGR